MRNLASQIFSWLVGFFILTLQVTCRIRIHNDPRETLTADGFGHVFGTFHAHQIGGFLAARRGTGVMVSRSVDGQIVVPSLRLCGHIPIRGSSGTGRKGGATALQALIEHVRQGHVAMLAVDGPRGPHGSVQKGIGLLSQKTNAAVLMAVAVPSRRWILERTWDRLQIPKPFSRIDVYIAEPLMPRKSEPLQQFTDRIEATLKRLEAEYDPQELAERSRAGGRRHPLRRAA
jgi:lysophospholipid acyltransferase (LPLAT)-like uncharacterized protein